MNVLFQFFYFLYQFFCKFFIFCRELGGTLTRANRTAGEDFLVDLRFFAPDDLAGLDVKPPEMWTMFWDDLAAGFPATRYLGLQRHQG